jgi:hypothetical protein
VLSISEIGGPSTPVGEGAPDFTLDPAYGTVELAAGFQPDPHTQQIAAGGAFDASQLGGTCVGWVAQAPDYRVNWTAGSGQLPLIFSVASDADTTLVINGADGSWICDDDGGNEGMNPSVSIQNAPSGQYDVWVGTYSQGELQDSTLHVSEVYVALNDAKRKAKAAFRKVRGLFFYQAPVFCIDAHGSFGAKRSPSCSSSIEMPSGERTNAM